MSAALRSQPSGAAAKVINLGGLPGSTFSAANGINDAGQAVGLSGSGSVSEATEWSDGSVIDLEGLAGSTNMNPRGINDAGQVVGVSLLDVGDVATEWSGGSVINLGGLPNAEAVSINDAGQAVGDSFFPPRRPSPNPRHGR